MCFVTTTYYYLLLPTTTYYRLLPPTTTYYDLLLPTTIVGECVDCTCSQAGTCFLESDLDCVPSANACDNGLCYCRHGGTFRTDSDNPSCVSCIWVNVAWEEKYYVMLFSTGWYRGGFYFRSVFLSYQTWPG